jgi:hypothetical protein
MCAGLGLSDGEGNGQVYQINRNPEDHHDINARTATEAPLVDRSTRRCAWDLGDWIKRRLDRGVNAPGATAKKILDGCGIGVQTPPR